MKGWADFRGVLIYLLIGVGVGAAIYGYLLEDLVFRIAGFDNSLAVPIAALIGVPLYIRAGLEIPIGLALMQKGMSTGVVLNWKRLQKKKSIMKTIVRQQSKKITHVAVRN